ncbi:SDR family oxidoreductase, partial [Bacillus spizizenii]|nr:SDR family oxidoreductase [Bacillus spizizenii]
VAARPMMTEGGSIVTLTYLGGELVMPNYNVMGVAKASLDASVKYLAADLGKENIRVNSISAGPIRTLSAKGISDFNSILKDIEERAPLRRTTTPEEVGDTAAFLFSDMSRGITGENLHVDSGFHITAR